MKTLFKSNFTDRTATNILTVLIVGILLASCNTEEELANLEFATTEQQTGQRSTSRFTISEEDALRSLEDILSEIDNPSNSGLRSTRREIRRVKSIETVNRGTQNSSSNALRAVTGESGEPLLYLVNFEDEEGYAILAADERIDESVLVIADEGSISEEEFYSNDSYLVYDMLNDCFDQDEVFNIYNAEEDDYYLASQEPQNRYIYQYAEESIESDLGGGGGGGTPSCYTVTGDWETNQMVPSMVRTAWHQDPPFNDKIPKSRWAPWLSYKQGPAGCVPIAVAQIMAYHECSYNLTVDGVPVSWSDVKAICSYDDRDGVGNSSTRTAVAELIRDIAIKCHAVYTPTFTFALPKHAAECLSVLGFYNAHRHYGYEDNQIKNMLNASKPVFVAAISGVFNGHAWVVDGYIDRSRIKKTIQTATGNEISSETENQLLVHCNWGWEGKGNGYYVSKIFKTGAGAVTYESGTNESLWDNGPDENFDWAYHTITY